MFHYAGVCRDELQLLRKGVIVYVEDGVKKYLTMDLHGGGDGAHLRYIMRIGSASSRYPLTDSELPSTSCGKLFPRYIPRAEETTLAEDGSWKLSFALGGALCELASTVTSVNNHLFYSSEFYSLDALLNGSRLGHKRLLPALRRVCLKKHGDTAGHKDFGKHQWSKLKGLRDLRAFILKKAATLDVDDAHGMNAFIADVMAQTAGQRERYGVIAGMQGAARRSMEAIRAMDQVYERAKDREPIDIQGRIGRDDWVLDFQSAAKTFQMKVGKIRSTLEQVCGVLDKGLDAVPAKREETIYELVRELCGGKKSVWVTDNGEEIARLPSLMTAAALDDLKIVAKMHTGESFYCSQPLPGCLHLLMRTVEKVVNLGEAARRSHCFVLCVCVVPH